MELPGLHACFVPRLLSPRPSLLNAASDARLNSSPQKPLDLKQLKQRAAAIPPIVSTPPARDGTREHSGYVCHMHVGLAAGLKDLRVCSIGLSPTCIRVVRMHLPLWMVELVVRRELSQGGVSSPAHKVLPGQSVFPAAGASLPAVFGCPLSSFIRKSWEVWTEKASCHMTAASRCFKKRLCTFPALCFSSCHA